MGDNRTDYSAFSVPNKAQKCLKAAFRKSKQDPKNYDLFPITLYIEKYLNYNERQFCRLTTTGEVIKSIQYMVDQELF